jgi:hypothetical protein
LTKLAATTASRALVSDASGFVSASTTTANELLQLSGITSPVQAQLSGKLNLSGGTMTGGWITLDSDPTVYYHAATKGYVDSRTMQTAYNVSSNPEVTTDATRNQVAFRQGGAAASTVLEVQNTAGNPTWTVSGAGTVVQGTTTTAVSVASTPAQRIYASGAGSAFEVRKGSSTASEISQTVIGGTEASPADTAISTDLASYSARGRFSAAESRAGAIKFVSTSTTQNRSNIEFYNGDGAGGLTKRFALNGDATVSIPGFAGTGQRLLVSDASGNISTPTSGILTSISSSTGNTISHTRLSGWTVNNTVNITTVTLQRIGNMVWLYFGFDTTSNPMTGASAATTGTFTVPGGWTVAGSTGTDATGYVFGNTSTGGGVSGYCAWNSSTTLQYVIRKGATFDGIQSLYFQATFITGSL